MPPLHGFLNLETAVQEIRHFKDYFDKVYGDSQREAGLRQLEQRLLELPKIRSRDEATTEETTFKLLHDLSELLQDTPSVLRPLNSLIEKEWIKAVLARGPLPQLPAKENVDHHRQRGASSICRLSLLA